MYKCICCTKIQNFWLEKSDTKPLKHNELTRLQNKNTRNDFKNAKNSTLAG